MTRNSTNDEPRTQVQSSSGQIMTAMPLGSLLIGVCGSSAAESTGELAEEALRYANDITVVATRTAAALFVSDLPVPLYTDADWIDKPLHVTLLQQADTLVIAPATATTLAKAAAGIADTLVTALICAHGPGVYFQPCMNARMWTSPAVRRAVDTLRGDGHHVLEPGPVASRASRTVGSGVGEIPGNVLATVAEHKRESGRN
ncbi:phosphopantothenoylcysteine decarboxylase / phosphopantothenate--cysteine ligase [Amycolatopsis marina]|uniref:Phosphopantothenoylcysteine decarboxylase / phosphopantothenate--cysteine ligase n=1 Tax=Amycolatopsis marina TaxID=490629 RepID=A0A1I1APP9_9PSEU|nr:flavoprotein [Amycolatopsis marina]SFB40019.1 phosphopantothenoylcysteine decarboxylase / phosphopantothenate--cysteine ligase [Amycolatopsis marina]